MNTEQQKEAISLMCLMLGALTVLAPKENETLQGLLSDVRDWLNTGITQARQATQGDEK